MNSELSNIMRLIIILSSKLILILLAILT